MADELAGARYARFINKRFSELGAEPFEKILEESRDLGAGWDLEELRKLCKMLDSSQWPLET